MADVGKSIKNIWVKGMTAIGNTANSIASNTRYKVEELNLLNRRNEILSDFGNKAYALWQKGVDFPEALENELVELSRLDEKLNALRVERLAGVKTGESLAEEPSRQAPPAGEKTEPLSGAAAEPAEEETAPAGAPVPVIRVEEPKDEPKDDLAPEKPVPSLHEEISGLFSRESSAAEMSEKVDSALDSLGESLRDFSDRVDEGLNELNDQLGEPKK